MQIIFTITEAQKQRVIDAIEIMFPVPIDPVTGAPEFSDGAWAKEKIRRMIIGFVHMHESRFAANQIAFDNDLVT